MSISLSNPLGTDIIPVGFNYGLTRYFQSTPPPPPFTPSNILITGGFSTVAGTIRNYQFSTANNNGGNLNSTWLTNVGSAFNTSTYNSDTTTDGAYVYVVGLFTSFNGSASNRFVKLNSDGTIAQTYPVGFNNLTHNVLCQSNGKVMVVGNFTSYDGVALNRIVRLNSDGTIDGTFNIGTGFDATVNDIAYDGTNYYVVGSFTTYNGAPCKGLAVIDGSGNLVYTYTGFNGTFTFYCKLYGGFLYVGGDSFTTFNGAPTPNRFVKMDITAVPSPDLSTPFNAGLGTGFNARVHNFSIDTNTGHVFLGGNFTSVNGIAKNFFAKLEPTGTLDATFPTSAPNNFLRFATLIHNENLVAIGGAFTDYAGVGARDRFAVVNKNGNVDATWTYDFYSGTFQEPYGCNEIA